MRREPEQLGPDANGAGDRAVGLLAPPAALGAFDQAGSEEHLDVEVQVAGIDVELLRQLAVGQALAALVAEHLEHTKAERMAERLELLGALDREDVVGSWWSVPRSYRSYI